MQNFLPAGYYIKTGNDSDLSRSYRAGPFKSAREAITYARRKVRSEWGIWHVDTKGRTHRLSIVRDNPVKTKRKHHRKAKAHRKASKKRMIKTVTSKTRTVVQNPRKRHQRRRKTRTRIVYRTRKIKVRSKPGCNYYGLRTGSGTKLYRITGSRMTTVGTFRRKGLTNYCRKHGIKC